MISDKPVVQQLIALFREAGIDQIVLSPGSRNAPLSLSFHYDPFFTTYTVADERVAAFVALGIIQATGKPVAVSCTSGSAILNYYPAVAEAYYQQLPLIVLSADRPTEWIDQGDGQTIRQHGVLDQHIKYSASLWEAPDGEAAYTQNHRSIQEALDAARSAQPGPVHLNLPFHEPLYGTVPTPAVKPLAQTTPPVHSTTLETDWQELRNIWASSPSRLILAGLAQPNEPLEVVLQPYLDTEQAALLTETTGNLPLKGALPCIDRVINTVSEETRASLQPDLLITFGGAVVSKMVKAWLRQYRPKHHWHIDPGTHAPDTYLSLTRHIRIHPEDFFQHLKAERTEENGYARVWQTLHAARQEEHTRFMREVPYSDLSVFRDLQQHIPTHGILQLGNSSPVRYAQLFEWSPNLRFYSNRGTSGIDGSTSTAVGYALQTDAPVTLITGDIAFFYDSNAFFHRHVPDNLRVIVIHNGGGGIFRIIQGPSSTEALEDVFEAHHGFSARGIASTFELDYLEARDTETLTSALHDLYDPNRSKATILEVHTPRTENDRILKQYFDTLKSLDHGNT